MVLRMVQLWPLGLDVRHPLRRVRATPRPVLPRRVPDTQGPGDLVVRPGQQLRRRRRMTLHSRINISGFYYMVSSHLPPDGSW